MIDGQLTESDKELFGQGMQFKDFTAQPAQVKTVKLLPQNQSIIEVTIHEGKYHQVKRMFEQVKKTSAPATSGTNWATPIR
ncbi:hypothetical protein [Holzapfeliella floricola]|uniref:hypothetical protein n=1 Tax=Holzapfeliella floricola TaxID=679249 RepID=UPI0007802765|nr:hypothetical protein [Holzapfeliella floricola]